MRTISSLSPAPSGRQLARLTKTVGFFSDQSEMSEGERVGIHRQARFSHDEVWNLGRHKVQVYLGNGGLQ